MLKYILAAAIAAATIVPTASAFAVPVAPVRTLETSTESSAIPIRDVRKAPYNKAQADRGGRTYNRNNNRNKFKYRAGGRYKNAPGGWHRYGARPGNWQTRGCIMVGPIWFCP